MFTTDYRKHWEAFGKTDPYYAVLTHDRYRREEMNPAAREEFFRTGEEFIRDVFDVLEQSFPALRVPRSALDFGCGVGRLTFALAKRISTVVGADVSQQMIDEATRNLEGRVHPRFVRVDETLSQITGSFDLIVSYIVFQHIPASTGMQIVERLLGRLNGGGFAVLHFAYALNRNPVKAVGRWARSHVPLVAGIVNLLRHRRFGEPYMQLNAYDLNRVFALLRAARCEQIAARFTRHGDVDGVLLFVRKQG